MTSAPALRRGVTGRGRRCVTSFPAESARRPPTLGALPASAPSPDSECLTAVSLASRDCPVLTRFSPHCRRTCDAIFDCNISSLDWRLSIIGCRVETPILAGDGADGEVPAGSVVCMWRVAPKRAPFGLWRAAGLSLTLGIWVGPRLYRDSRHIGMNSLTPRSPVGLDGSRLSRWQPPENRRVTGPAAGDIPGRLGDTGDDYRCLLLDAGT